jgi:hypothetical protein
MRPYLKWLPTMALCLVCACASAPKIPQTVDLKGFVISRPTQEGWQVVSQTAEQWVMTKSGDFMGDTMAFQASVIVLPAFNNSQELVRYAESNLRRELDRTRLRVLQLKVRGVDIQGQACAMAYLETAERAGADGTGSPVNTMLDSLTLTCPHPKSPARGISSAYSHRHLPEDKDPAFEQAATALLSTLKFSSK